MNRTEIEYFDVNGKTCYAYFKGKDGLGICNTKCQWFNAKYGCPAWSEGFPHDAGRGIETPEDLNVEVSKR